MLRVTDWDRLYETHQTRRLKHLQWVPVPNRMDGDGYVELTDHQDGMAHLGCWLAILEIASRCSPRGVLARGPRAIDAHDARSIARIARATVQMMESAIARLVEIGWLEQINAEESTIARIQHGTARDDVQMTRGNRALDTRRMEGNGREGKDTPPTPSVENRDAVISGWDEFVSSYPEPKRGVGVERGCRAYVGRIDGTDGEHARLMAGLRRWLASDQWVRSLADDGGKYIPTMERFIADGRYLDNPPPAEAQPKTSGGAISAAEFDRLNMERWEREAKGQKGAA